MSSSLIKQLIKRRKALRLTQTDMEQKTGIARQQYGKIERDGNPRLSTLEQMAFGLDAELFLIPAERRLEVIALLSERTGEDPAQAHLGPESDDSVADPWQEWEQHNA
ncbi:helix-turn-helix transcriptional regulator (plasmid) [Pseudomonas luteola]|uniref:helix-turn-helix transcriptional regulator n=1 Tax=Pseudomonas luteola TaxID=47886 RepID=UPI003DA0DAC0